MDGHGEPHGLVLHATTVRIARAQLSTNKRGIRNKQQANKSPCTALPLIRVQRLSKSLFCTHTYSETSKRLASQHTHTTHAIWLHAACHSAVSTIPKVLQFILARHNVLLSNNGHSTAFATAKLHKPNLTHRHQAQRSPPQSPSP